jgi:hypothetical protein
MEEKVIAKSVIRPHKRCELSLPLHYLLEKWSSMNMICCVQDGYQQAAWEEVPTAARASHLYVWN